MASAFPNTKGSPYFYGSITVGSTATLLVPADSNRRGLAIVNEGSEALYIGFDIGVTTSEGIPIIQKGNKTDSGFRDNFVGAIYGISASGGLDARVMWWVR